MTWLEQTKQRLPSIPSECPNCMAPVRGTYTDEFLLVTCGACGCALKGPVGWEVDAGKHLTTSNWPFSREPLLPLYFYAFGLMSLACSFVDLERDSGLPFITLFLGVAVILEGVHRSALRRKRRGASQPWSTVDIPVASVFDWTYELKQQLGAITAAWVGSGRLLGATKLATWASTCAAFAFWLVHGGLNRGSPKIVVVGIAAGGATLYLAWQSVRLILVGQAVFVFAQGLIHVVGNRQTVVLWKELTEIAFVYDAHIALKFHDREIARLTRMYFWDLDAVGVRVVAAATDRIANGDIMLSTTAPPPEQNH